MCPLCARRTNHFLKCAHIWHLRFQMARVIPILAQNTLDHFIVDGVLGIWIRPMACAINAREILVVCIQIVILHFHRVQFAADGQNFWCTTIASEITFCVQFDQFMTIVASVGACQANTSSFLLICLGFWNTSQTCIQCLPFDIALQEFVAKIRRIKNVEIKSTNECDFQSLAAIKNSPKHSHRIWYYLYYRKITNRLPYVCVVYHILMRVAVNYLSYSYLIIRAAVGVRASENSCRILHCELITLSSFEYRLTGENVQLELFPDK